jgi:hypothetical protein
VRGGLPAAVSDRKQSSDYALADGGRQIGLRRHACAIETLLSERTALFNVAHLVGGVAKVTEVAPDLR